MCQSFLNIMYERNEILIKISTIVLLIILIFRETGACENNHANKRIVVIGAGPSGIAAASKLLQYGFKNTLILEAENRIGGRIYTTSLGNYSVDLGGQWVHGEKGNVAFELAHPLGLLDKTDRPDFGFVQEFVDSRGAPLDEELAKNLTDFFTNYVSTGDYNDTSYESLGEYLENAFDTQFKGNPSIMNERKKYLNYFELARMSSESAESWYDVSIKGLNEYAVYPGDQLVNWKNRGYSTILDILMKRYPTPENELAVMNNTLLDSEVISINYLNDTKDVPVAITTAKGKVYEADHAIVTISVGVLKDKHRSLFIPPLPDYKIEAIKGIGFGSVAKIYLLFDRAFWDLGNRRILQFSFVWNDAERKVVEADPERKWTLGIFGALTVESKPNLLTLWITEGYANQMEAIPEERVFDQVLEHLRRFLDGRYKVGAPIAMLRSRWHSNPHFRGTYSYQSKETYERRIVPEALERPLAPEALNVLFAGEATSDHRYSTVDGAIGSGWRAADRLIDRYGAACEVDA